MQKESESVIESLFISWNRITEATTEKAFDISSFEERKEYCENKSNHISLKRHSKKKKGTWNPKQDKVTALQDFYLLQMISFQRLIIQKPSGECH